MIPMWIQHINNQRLKHQIQTLELDAQDVFCSITGFDLTTTTEARASPKRIARECFQTAVQNYQYVDMPTQTEKKLLR